MKVEKLKYTIWAADGDRAVGFYQRAFGALVTRWNAHIIELEIAGSILAIHTGGEGKRTWTGLTFQVADVVLGAADVIAAGGQCPEVPQPEGDEPPHLAQCLDTENNQIMLSRKRGT